MDLLVYKSQTKAQRYGTEHSEIRDLKTAKRKSHAKNKLGTQVNDPKCN